MSLKNLDEWEFDILNLEVVSKSRYGSDPNVKVTYPYSLLLASTAQVHGSGHR